MVIFKMSLKSSEPTVLWFRDFNFHVKKCYSGGFVKPSHIGVANIRSYFSLIIRDAFPGGSASKKGINVLSPNRSVSKTLDLLEAYEDEYDGAIINPECLPTSANAFASILRASLSDWKLKAWIYEHFPVERPAPDLKYNPAHPRAMRWRSTASSISAAQAPNRLKHIRHLLDTLIKENGKKGIWLKILTDQADLVPVAIKEGFNYHHAEPGYVMLVYWIPKEPCMLPSNASHQVGIGAFVINDKREVLVVQEKQCPLRCSNLWKLPTGFIHESEEIFSGAAREVKEETGIETTFIEVIAFRHCHLVAFEKSDLFFICALKPLSSHITIDDTEIKAAKWMPLDEFLGQQFYQEDCMMSKKMLDICIASFENSYRGFTAHQLNSKFDGRLAYLYYNNPNNT